MVVESPTNRKALHSGQGKGQQSKGRYEANDVRKATRAMPRGDAGRPAEKAASKIVKGPQIKKCRPQKETGQQQRATK